MVYETIKSLLFYLDTRVRSSGTIGSPRFSFPNNLIGLQPQNGELIKLTMQEASIEYTFYQTELFNNKFLVIEEVAGEPVLNRLISVEIGNYNLITFIIELTAKMNDSSYYTYLITYEANTNRLKYIAIPKPPFTQLSVVFNFNADNVLELTGDDVWTV